MNWISVEDRLPEPGTKLYAKIDDVELGFGYVWENNFIGRTSDISWSYACPHEIGSTEDPCNYHEQITHWKPYKEQE